MYTRIFRVLTSFYLSFQYNYFRYYIYIALGLSLHPPPYFLEVFSATDTLFGEMSDSKLGLELYKGVSTDVHFKCREQRQASPLPSEGLLKMH